MADLILAIGVLFLIFFVVLRQILGRPPVTTRADPSMAALMRRLNIALAVFGVALIVLVLLLPDM